MNGRLVAAIIGLVFGIAALVVIAGRQRFRARVTVEVNALFSDAAASVGAEQLRARSAALPEPVRRYLGYAIPDGAPAIRTARLKHDGFLRTTPDSQWFRVSGEEYFAVAQPGFVWIATAWPAWPVWFEARDSLLSNRADMLVKLYSTLTIAHGSGAQMAQGARLRWLAENVWFPFGFVGDQIRWEPIDNRTARMTLQQDGLPVSAIVEIDDEGKLTSIRAERYRDVGGGRAVLTPWFGRCSDYKESGGFRVPWSIEVGWVLEDGEFDAIRFRVTELQFNVSGRF